MTQSSHDRVYSAVLCFFVFFYPIGRIESVIQCELELVQVDADQLRQKQLGALTPEQPELHCTKPQIPCWPARGLHSATEHVSLF